MSAPIELMPIPAHVTATCRAHFGHHATRNGRRQLVDNRCDSCPLRTPCLKWGGASARTVAELEENRAAFVTTAVALLGEVPA